MIINVESEKNLYIRDNGTVARGKEEILWCISIINPDNSNDPIHIFDLFPSMPSLEEVKELLEKCYPDFAGFVQTEDDFYSEAVWINDGKGPKKYEVVEDMQGGSFGMDRQYTARQWLEQAEEWADTDGNEELLETLKAMDGIASDSEILDFIAEIWQIVFDEVKQNEDEK